MNALKHGLQYQSRDKRVVCDHDQVSQEGAGPLLQDLALQQHMFQVSITFIRRLFHKARPFNT